MPDGYTPKIPTTMAFPETSSFLFMSVESSCLLYNKVTDWVIQLCYISLNGANMTPAPQIVSMAVSHLGKVLSSEPSLSAIFHFNRCSACASVTNRHTGPSVSCWRRELKQACSTSTPLHTWSAVGCQSNTCLSWPRSHLLSERSLPCIQPAPTAIIPGWQKETSSHRGCQQYTASWSGSSTAWCHAPPSLALGLQPVQPHRCPITELWLTAKPTLCLSFQCPVSWQLQETFGNLQLHQWLWCQCHSANWDMAAWVWWWCQVQEPDTSVLKLFSFPHSHFSTAKWGSGLAFIIKVSLCNHCSTTVSFPFPHTTFELAQVTLGLYKQSISFYSVYRPPPSKIKWQICAFSTNFLFFFSTVSMIRTASSLQVTLIFNLKISVILTPRKFVISLICLALCRLSVSQLTDMATF